MERWLYIIRLRLRSLFRRTSVERELHDELQDHMRRRIDHYVAEGIPLEEARYDALRAMDGIEPKKEECRDMRRTRFFDDLIQDIRYTTRSLISSPGFTAVALISL